MPRLFIDIEGRFAQFQNSLDAVRRSTEQTARSLDSAFSTVRSTLGRLAGLGTVAFAIKGVLDSAQQLNTLSQRTKITVEDLGALKFAAEQSNVSFDSLAAGLSRLGRSIAAAGAGDTKLERLFTRLGMPDAAKGTEDVFTALFQLAGVMSKLTNEQQDFVLFTLMGRGAAELKPLLNQGTDALEGLINKGRQVNGITTDFAHQADQFGNNLKEIKTHATAAAVSLGGDFLTATNKIIAAFTHGLHGGLTGAFAEAADKLHEMSQEGEKAPRVLAAIAVAIGGLRLASFVGAEFGAFVDKLKAVQTAVSNTSQALAAQGNAAIIQRELALNAQFNAEKQLAAAQAAVAAATGFQRLAIVEQQLVPAQKAVATATAAVATAEVAVAERATAAGVATSLFGRAITAIGGPVSAILTLLSLGASAWLLFGDNAKKAGDKVSGTVKQLQDALQGLKDQRLVGLTGNQLAPLFAQNEKEAEGIKEQIKTIEDAGKAKIEALKNFENAQREATDAAATINPNIAKQGAKARAAQIDQITKDIEAQTAPLKKELATRETLITQIKEQQKKLAQPTPKKIDLGNLGEPPKSNVAADKLRVLSEQLGEQKQNFTDALQGVDRLVEDNNTTLDGAFNARVEILQRFRDQATAVLDQMDAINKRRVIRTDTPQNKATDLEEQEKARVDIAKQRADVERAVAQEALKNFDSNTKAVKQYNNSLKDAEATLLELQGRTREAVLIRFDIQTQDFKKLLELQAQFAEDPAKRQQASDALRQIARARELSGFNAESQQLQDRIQQLRDQQSAEEDRIAVQQKAGALTDFQAQSRLAESRKATVVQLAEIAAQYDKIAQASGDRRLIQNAQNFRVEVEKLASEADVLRDKFEGVLSQGVGNTLEKLMNGEIRSLRDLLRSFSDDIVKQINSLVAQNIAGSLFGKQGQFGAIPGLLSKVFGGVTGTQAPAPVRDVVAPVAGNAANAAAGAAVGEAAKNAEAQAGTAALTAATTNAATAVTSFGVSLESQSAVIQPALTALATSATEASLALKLVASSSAGSAGAGAGGKIIGSGFEALVASSANVGHTGGIVGELAKSRVVSLAAFRNARRFHSGGVAGEVNIIAKKGEGIFTESQMKRLAPVTSSGQPVNVYNTFQLMAPADPRTQSQIAAQAGLGVNRALKRNR